MLSGAIPPDTGFSADSSGRSVDAVAGADFGVFVGTGVAVGAGVLVGTGVAVGAGVLVGTGVGSEQARRITGAATRNAKYRNFSIFTYV